jgi:glycosyltransferase involved in cell wall biosynthesis
MRVLMFPDALPFELPGGLRVQVRETLDALNALGGRDAGMRAVLAEPGAARQPECDVVHLFGAASAATLEAALATHAPLVLSPRLSCAWNSANGTRARVADRVQGNRSKWDFDSGYAQIRRALQAASLVVALDEAERKAVCDAFLLAPAKVRVIAQGIGQGFFDADPALFRARTRIAGRFALMAGQVSPYANQLGVGRALAELALPLVVIGDARERDAGYLRELRALRTVTCIGALDHDDPLLASAYAAASVLVLASRGSGWPMTVPEALASGTPAVSSAGKALQLPDGRFAVRPANWYDATALKQAVSQLLEQPPEREAVRALVRPFTWHSVACQLAACYRDLLRQQG